MKKVMMMLAVVACAASAMADVSAIAVKIYLPSVYSSTAGGWVAADGTCLSDLDRNLTTETHRTAPHNSSDNSWQGSQEPYSTVNTPAADYTYAIRKDEYGTEGKLATGYSCYLIQGTTYADLAKELGTDELCYSDFVSKYSAYKTLESANSAIYYGFNGQKHLQQTITSYADGTSVTTLDPNDLVAVMTYLDDDGSAAQYALVQFDRVGSGNVAWFQSSLESGSGVTNVTSWQDFASIPEPTSGLLLLLGVAGLALKRKRA